MTPPKFRHGQLRLVLLTLIARRPQHGYELIQELSELFNGNYAPSAGTIYPRLAKLESEGLVTKHDDGRKTVYAITPEGQTEVDARADEFAQIIAESAESIAPQADSARDGLMQARLALRNELDWLASELRSEAAGGDGGADGVAFDAAGSAGGAASATDASLGADGAGAGAAGASAADAAGAGATGASSADAAGAAGADDEAEQAQPTPDDLVREVDQLLQRFRQDVRQDARLAARSGSLVSEAVTDLGHSLGEYARRFAEQVGIHRR
ncbi:PadR family transcriptional regulator [Gulosibacter hominis]|uniref:PadR family transcriptional regulator n=1 Tax=Gulosibacter hominis TaxID=2770504 RepID=UPI001918F449|nr:PadR family transcriptional regulator [Gulosibacter hominis]